MTWDRGDFGFRISDFGFGADARAGVPRELRALRSITVTDAKWQALTMAQGTISHLVLSRLAIWRPFRSLQHASLRKGSFADASAQIRNPKSEIRIAPVREVFP